MAGPVVVASAVREVQVYRSGAVVARVATLDAGWPDELAVDGLPLALDDDSVRATILAADGRAGGDALPRPADVRAELALPDPGAALAPSEVELRDATRRVDEAQAQLQGVEGELSWLERFELNLADPDPETPATPRPAPVAAWNGLLAWNGDARARRIEEREQLRDLVRVAVEARARLLQREHVARARRDARVDGLRKRVVLRLRGGERATPLVVRIEYQVPGARWVPSYVLRVARDGASAELALRAHVVQRSGEAWERVRLSLSTADLRREMALPELTSLRIGRRQPTPPRRAWREPPSGTDALFEGLDLALRALPRPLAPAPASPQAQPVVVHAGRDRPDEAKKKKAAAPSPPPLGGSMPIPAMSMAPPPPPPRPPGAPVHRGAPMAAPMPAMSAPAAKGTSAAGAGGGAMAPQEAFADMDEGGGPPGGAPHDGSPPGLAGPVTVRPDGAALRYADLRMPAWDDRRTARGKLRPLQLADLLANLEGAEASTIARRLVEAQALAQAASAPGLPPGTTPVESSAGSYDHRYDCEGPVDVPSDGALHNIALLAQRAPVKTTLVVVPRESDQAVRVATLTNPLDAPLLAGPAEVYLEDEFLVSAPLRTVPAGGEVVIGLGLEPALKVARNTFYEERTHGLLGGSLTLEHRLEVEVASRLAAPVTVEVRERVPVPADPDAGVKVTETSTPGWEKLRAQEDPGAVVPQGGRRWRITLAPGAEKKLVATYTVELDTKNELVGGNRRD